MRHLCLMIFLIGSPHFLHAKETKEDVPPIPPSHILDLGNVFLPETAKLLSGDLTAAQEKGVSVYVVTIPSLKVLKSKQSERLEQLANDYATAWLPKQPGAVLLFDDEGGLMTVVTSKEAEKRFSSFIIEMKFRQALAKIPPAAISREKLQRSAIIVAETLGLLEVDAAKADRRQWLSNLFMGLLALVGVGLAVYSYLSGPTATPETKSL
ncbi:MAG: hypothetical protein WCI46_00385 [Verrucomicrobiota bacterium]